MADYSELIRMLSINPYMTYNGQVMNYAKVITTIMDNDLRPTATPEQLKNIEDFLDVP